MLEATQKIVCKKEALKMLLFFAKGKSAWIQLEVDFFSQWCQFLRRHIVWLGAVDYLWILLQKPKLIEIAN